MSDPARALALTALSERRAGFAPDQRFATGRARPVAVQVDPAAVAPQLDEDPVARAYADGYAQGAREGRAAAEAEAAIADAARHRIELALGRMDAQQIAQLHDRLRETVETLCEAALGDAAVDPAHLEKRIGAAAAMLARAEDARVIRLHPEDLALVAARLPAEWTFEPDATLERGAIRVEGAQGGVEEGPEQWRRALQEALRSC